jgi:hypothetical protein
MRILQVDKTPAAQEHFRWEASIPYLALMSATTAAIGSNLEISVWKRSACATIMLTEPTPMSIDFERPQIAREAKAIVALAFLKRTN